MKFPLHKTFSILLLAMTGIFTGPAIAGMYRWVDDQGNVVYSQQPPPDDRDTKVIAPPPPPAENTGNSLDRTRELNRKLDAMARERQKAREKQRQAKAERTAMEKRCASARQDLKTLNERPPNTLYNMPDGGWKRLTPEERATRIEMLNKAIKENCR